MRAMTMRTMTKSTTSRPLEPLKILSKLHHHRFYYLLLYMPSKNSPLEEEIPLVGCDMGEFTSVDDLRGEMEELRALVNTLLTVIMEEADGVNSGSAQPQTPLPKSGYSM